MIFEDKIYQFKLSDYEKFRGFIGKNFSPTYILADRKFLEWQYGKTPQFVQKFRKNKLLSLLLLKEGVNIFGYLGIIPLKYKVFGSPQKIHVYANIFTDPALRGLGMGTLLIRKGSEGSRQALVIGYKPHTFSSYKKLDDWRELGNFSRFLIVFNNSSVNNIVKKNNKKSIPASCKFRVKSFPPLRGTYAYTKIFNSDFDAFWKIIRNKYKITAERTSGYLNWRYANHPYFAYRALTARNGAGEVTGYLIYRFEEAAKFKIARIIDFISLDEFETNLLHKFIQDIIREKADMADFMFSGNYHRTSLSEVGFFDAGETALNDFPVLFNPISYKRTHINFTALTKVKKQQRQFYNLSNWYLTKGDGDQDRPN